MKLTMNKNVKKILFCGFLSAQISLCTISCINNFQHNYSKGDKEYFENLENDVGLDKLPYKLSNILKENFATPINVSYVKDGDTFLDSKGNKYRLAGIDTPESFIRKNNQYIPTTGIQKKYATLAYKFTEYYVLNGLLSSYSKYKFRPTQIYAVPQKTKNGIFDYYGRIVAIIYYQDEFGIYHCLNQKLLLEGKARMHYISLSKNNIFYTNNVKYFQLLESAQDLARKKHKGIWEYYNLFSKIFPN